ncbi:MAG: invasion associated locus B family protein [Oceanicaulis sp.]
MRSPLAALAALAALTAPAAAQQGAEPVFQGAHQDWRVFTRGEGDAKVCYALSRPTESLPASVDHGEVFFLVSSWANGAADEQPSFLAGYPLRNQSPPRARVGSDRFTMFVSEREGFLEEPRDESRLVDAMRRGAVMRVEAVSQRGTATAYQFSLSGVTAALDKVEDLCR